MTCAFTKENFETQSKINGWSLSNIPQMCNCGKPFSDDHAMVCHMGGFPTIRHNEIRDITALLLTEVHNVATEPCLVVKHSTYNLPMLQIMLALIYICARGFWNIVQDAFFDVWVFHPTTNLQAAYKKHESSIKREYGQRVRDREHTTCLLHNRWRWSRSNNILQASSRLDLPEAAEALLYCDELVEVLFVLCNPSLGHNVHTWQPVLSTPPYSGCGCGPRNCRMSYPICMNIQLLLTRFPFPVYLNIVYKSS